MLNKNVILYMKDTRFSVRPLRCDYKTYSPFLSYTITTSYVKPHTKNLIRRTLRHRIELPLFKPTFYIFVFTRNLIIT